jgi:transposase
MLNEGPSWESTINPVFPSTSVSIKTIGELQAENQKLRQSSKYWESQFRMSQIKIETLKSKIAERDAEIKKLKKKLFGKKSEGGKGGKGKGKGKGGKKGQKPGSQGHGRKRDEDLPVEEQIVECDDRFCKTCGKEYAELGSTEDSETTEVEVKAHIRKIKRKRYKRKCKCKKSPEFITAPKPPVKPIAKGKYGVSVWTLVILHKYLWQIPTHRLLQQLRNVGLKNIAPGTINGGLKTLAPIFRTLAEAIIKFNKASNHFHADETRWMVFVEVPGKKSHKWWLWVLRTPTSVVFLIKQSRGAKVLTEHFDESSCGVINADRYSAYKSLVNQTGRFIIAFCWAHVRRDFLDEATSFKDTLFEHWAFEWVHRIAELYNLNDERLKYEPGTKEFEIAEKALSKALKDMQTQCKVELETKALPESCQKRLISLLNHWAGLTLFFTYSWIPMDNNKGENQIRGPVVGRKGYYGSGSEWSAQLTADLFTILSTQGLWGLNENLWLNDYLTECARYEGAIPSEVVKSYLPWNMNDETLIRFEANPSRRPQDHALTGKLTQLQDGLNQNDDLFVRPNIKGLRIKEPLSYHKVKKDTS